MIKSMKKFGFSSFLFFSANKSGYRRGVAILITNKLNFEKISETGGKKGRYVLVTLGMWGRFKHSFESLYTRIDDFITSGKDKIHSLWNWNDRYK